MDYDKVGICTAIILFLLAFSLGVFAVVIWDVESLVFGLLAFACGTLGGYILCVTAKSRR